MSIASKLLQLALPFSFLLTSPATAVTIQTIALQGAPLPGLPAETFAEPRSPRLSVDGRTGFAAADSSSTLSDGLWVADAAGSLTAIHPAGSAMPGAGGALLGSGAVEPFVSGGAGVSGVLAGTGVDATNQLGFWVWDEGSGLSLLEREGTVVPETNGAVLADPDLPAWTSGAATYRARLVGGDATAANDHVLLRSGPTGTRVVLREGEPAPGLPGQTIQSTFAQAFEGEDGALLVVASTTGASAVTAFYRSAGESLELLFHSDEPVPGFPGATLEGVGFGAASFTQDEFAFAGSVNLPVFDPIDEGVWRVDAAGARLLIAREGETVDGYQLFDVADARPSLAADGRIVFEANGVDASFDAFSSIVLHDPDTGLELVARVDAPIPGMLDATFAGFFRDPEISDQGEIAFYGGIREPGVPQAGAIFARLADGTFVVVARGGQPFEVSPGVFRAVENVNLANSPTARFLSNNGRLAFRLEFTDGTAGIFVAVLPEPSGAALLLGAAAALGVRVARQQRHTRRDG